MNKTRKAHRVRKALKKQWKISNDIEFDKFVQGRFNVTDTSRSTLLAIVHQEFPWMLGLVIK